MDDGARKWLAKTAAANLWRVAIGCDLEDLIADGALCWQLMLRKYPNARDAKHRMRLFQRIYRNYLITHRHNKLGEIAVAEVPDTAIDADAELLQLVYEAPMPLRACLLAVLAHPERTASPPRRWLDGHRETTDHWLKRLAGVVSDIDVAQQLRELLTS